MKNTVLKTLLITASLGALLGLPGAMAATVIWSGPQAIGDGSTAFSVSTGEVVFAADKVSSNATPVTVGGIAFADAPTVGVSTAIGGFSNNANNYTGGTDADLNALLDFRYGSFDTNNTTLTISLSGLELGNDYIVRLYFADTQRTPDRILTATGGANTSDSFKAEDAVYLAGSFTADGATQNITVSGASGSFPVVNAVLVTTVPEPSAVLLGGLGVLALLRRRR